MNIEELLFSIEGALTIGAIIGLIVGTFVNHRKLGCSVLIAIPIAMVVYICWWQGEHPENLRSTSALDFFFGPLWPSLGAVGGYYVGVFVRSLFVKEE